MATKWTVMVYLGADNNLSVDFLWNLKEMQEIDQVGGSDKPVTVVAQYDPGQGNPTQRYIINRKSLEAREFFFPTTNKKGQKTVPPSSSRDGWLILDDFEIQKMIAGDVKKVLGKLKTIITEYEEKSEALRKQLVTDPGLKRRFGLKNQALTEQQEDLLKEYFRTPEGLSKLRKDTLRNLVLEFELSKAREERFREYQTTLAGSKDPKNKNTGDPMTLLEFIFWGINNFPATHYMVVLAGHGSGAVDDFLLKDENAEDSLTLHELRDVFELVQEKLDGRKLDILGMDSCLMSMAEVYYQLAGNVDYLVGAEGFEPSGGWPYHRILDSLIRLIAASKAATPAPELERDKFAETFANDIVDKYILYYFDYALAGLSVDLSACKIVEDESLEKLIAQLGLRLRARLENRAGLELVISSRHKAQCYKFDQYVDLVDLCDKLAKELKKANPSPEEDPLYLLCAEVRRKVTEEIVKNSSYVGPDCQESNGLSVYFPWNSVPKAFAEGYEQLQFTRRTSLKLTRPKINALKKELKFTEPTDLTLHTNSEWYRFIETFTEKMRALIPTEGAEGKTLFSAATLHSARTLYGAPGTLYGAPGTLYGHPGTQGSGGSVMAYCKPPSLVWKPKAGKVRTQLNKVRDFVAKGPRKGTAAAVQGLEKLIAENLGVKK